MSTTKDKSGVKKKNTTNKVKKEKVPKKKNTLDTTLDSKLDTEIESKLEESTNIESTIVESTNVESTNVDNTTLLTSDTNNNKQNKKQDPILDILNSLSSKYDSMEKEIKTSKTDLKKVIKLYEKKSFKNKRKYDPNRTPSGFAKPSLISKELCMFLNKPEGSKMARTDVTKEVNIYIKEHNLQNPLNKKKITPNETLRKLLNINKNDDSLTYFSMQKYLKDHFPKEESSVTS